MIYFTADLHLGHANIIKHCDRPFSSVGEMDEYLISAWNSRVRPNDNIYIIGDLIFRSTASPESYLNKLNGKKHLIIGNHDSDWIKKVELTKYFITLERFFEFSDGQNRITLCHYPLMSWNKMAKGSYMIHGHIHNNQNGIYFPLIRQMPNLLNAGVEINNFYPVTLNELIKNNENFKSASEEKEAIDKAVKSIGVLAEAMQGMAENALVRFKLIADDIINGKVVGENDIGYQLDFMLDYCYDEKVYELYKGVLDKLNDKYPELVIDYFQIYRDMWESEE